MIRSTHYRETNVLRVAFEGQVGRHDFDEMERDLPSIFRCLQPDFALLTDLSEVKEIEYSCAGAIGKLMEQLVEAGAGRVVRVVPDPRKDIGFGILSAFHYPANLPVQICGDLEEAKELLGLKAFTCLRWGGGSIAEPVMAFAP